MASRENQASNVIDLSDALKGAKPSFELSRQVTQSVRETGKLPDWFGPGTPMRGGAPQDLMGRQFAFPVGTNNVITPRNDARFTFAQLRAVADSWDLLRLLIETRKDQVCKLQWSIAARDKQADSEKKRIKEITAFLQKPDKEHDWPTWLRMLLDDLLVIDAPAMYPRYTADKKLYSLDPIDGGSIKRIVDDFGRTPISPYPAYQQILYGYPSFNYTREELIYKPRNMRTNRMYGVSPVELIMTTVTLALNRQAHQVEYYQNGSTPDLILSLPKEWTPEMVKDFRAWWTSVLEGNTAARRGTMFVPDGSRTIDTKEAILKDTFDEWIARIACFLFNQSVTPFVAQVNRATAEVAKEQAAQDGLASTMQWVVSLMNDVIANQFQSPDLEFVFGDTKELDPETAARIDDVRIKNDSLTINEVRKRNGEEPIEGGDIPYSQRQALARPSFGPAQSGVPGTPAAADGSAPVVEGEAPTTESAAAAGNVQATALNGAQIASLQSLVSDAAAKALPIESVRAIILAAFPVLNAEQVGAIIGPLSNFQPPTAVEPSSSAVPGAPAAVVDSGPASSGDAPKEPEPVAKAATLAQAIAAKLATLGASVAAQLNAALSVVEKADGSQYKRIKKIIAALSLSELEELIPLMEAALRDAMLPGFERAFIQVGGDENSDAWALSTTRATEYASEHAAELVTDLDEATRDFLRASVTEAMDKGLSGQELADLIESQYAFSPERALLIAETEQTAAVMQGEIEGWKASGVVAGTQWLIANSENECEICQGNADAGTIPLGDPYPSGDYAPPVHPRCQCSLSPVLSDDATE